jgi:hypothetical protein
MESCEYGNKLSGSINGEGCIDKLSDYQLIKKDLLHGVS